MPSISKIRFTHIIVVAEISVIMMKPLFLTDVTGAVVLENRSGFAYPNSHQAVVPCRSGWTEGEGYTDA